MTRTNESALVAALKQKNKGAEFISLDYIKPYNVSAAYKKQGVTAHALIHYTGLILGGDYKTKCERAATKSGNPNAIVEPKKGHLNHITTFLCENSGIYRLFAQLTNACRREVTYYINNVECTLDELKKVCRPSDFAEHKMSSTQVDAGISAENEVRVLEFRFDRIISTKVDGVLYD